MSAEQPAPEWAIPEDRVGMAVPHPDPRIEAAAAAMWETQCVAGAAPWEYIAAVDQELTDRIRTEAAAAVAAADLAALPDPRLDVVAKALHSWERQPFSDQYEKVHPEFRETFRFRASLILAALDEAA